MKAQFTLAMLAAACMGKLSFSDKQECLDFFAEQGQNDSLNEDFEEHCENFNKNKKIADELNQNPNSKATFAPGIFAAESDSDIAKHHFGLIVPEEENEDSDQDEDGIQLQSADLEQYYINWETMGKVHAPKNQGSCGSCWAFAATTVQESMQSIKKNKAPVRLSEQEAVDCTRWSCNGGWMADYWIYSKDFGSMTGDDYPYQASDNLCRNQDLKNSKHEGYRIASKVDQYRRIDKNPLAIAQALQEGPLSVTVNADHCWMNYYGGILTDADDCVRTGLNHAVTLIGLAVQDGLEYWIIRNSWSSGWGDNGNIHIAVTYGDLGISAMMQKVEALTVQDGYDPELWNEDGEESDGDGDGDGDGDACDIDESMNDLGPGWCIFDEDCKGDRFCDDEGMCMGQSGCDGDDGDNEPDLCAINEKLNYFGPFQCESHDDCKGDRKCNKCGECSGAHNCVA